MGRRHVLKRLPGWYLTVTCRIGYYFGRLSSSSVSTGTEVRPVSIYTGLPYPSAYVPTHVAPAGKTINPLVERIGGRDILEYLRVGAFRVACRVRYDLSELPSCYLIIRTERTITIARYDPSTGKAAYDGVEGIPSVNIRKIQHTSYGGCCRRHGCWCGCAC